MPERKKQRWIQSPGLPDRMAYPEGTGAREALDELNRITEGTVSQYNRWIMEGNPVSDYVEFSSPYNRNEGQPDPALTRRVFSGLRPEMRAEEPWSKNPSDENYALPPVPATFTPSPLVVGQDAAKWFEQLSAINPEIRRTIRSITTGPDSGYIRDTADKTFLGKGKEPLLPNSLRGRITATNLNPDPEQPQYRDMYLDPFQNRQDLRQTIAHELGHVLMGESDMGFLDDPRVVKGAGFDPAEVMAERLRILLRKLPQTAWENANPATYLNFDMVGRPAPVTFSHQLQQYPLGRVPGLRIEDVK